MDAGGRPGCQAPGGKSGGPGSEHGHGGDGRWVWGPEPLRRGRSGGRNYRRSRGHDRPAISVWRRSGVRVLRPRQPQVGGASEALSGGPRRAALGLRVPCEVAPARSRLLAKAGCEVHGAPRAVTGESRVSSLRRGHRVSCASLRPCVPPLVRPLARRAAVMFLRSQLSGSGSPRTMASRSLSYF